MGANIVNLFVACLAVAACSNGAPGGLVPSPTGPTGGAPAPAGPATVQFSEPWILRVTIVNVTGAAACLDSVGQTRTLTMGIDRRKAPMVVLFYDRQNYPTDHLADFTGVIDDGQFSGEGRVYEGIPCVSWRGDAGSRAELRGRFSADGQSFTGQESRRYTDPTAFVVDLVWQATRERAALDVH